MRRGVIQLLASGAQALSSQAGASTQAVRHMGSERRPGESGAWKQSESRPASAAALVPCVPPQLIPILHVRPMRQSSGSDTRATGRTTPLSSARPRTSPRVGYVAHSRRTALSGTYRGHEVWLAGVAVLHREQSNREQHTWQRAVWFTTRAGLCRAVLDDSASMLLLTEVWRGMSYTLGAFFDKKVTVSRSRQGRQAAQKCCARC
jgi:hypothetical protein